MSSPSHAPLPTDIADRLLELLSTDDAFRQVFQKNPTAALSELGYEPARIQLESQDGPPGQGSAFYCMTSQQLASKEEIIQARKELAGHLAATGNHHVVFCFEAGKIASRVSRK
ncbi:MAG TPA: putative modified peptide [Xanthomonadaceae bacterium]|nr:putative modified peptide [Xanthomonadaceae bacterium]